VTWIVSAREKHVLPGSRGFIGAIVTAQVPTQIGAFTLPALLAGFIASWRLSKAEAGPLVGAFFAAYVASVQLGRTAVPGNGA
jgi:hypothetical protein